MKKLIALMVMLSMFTIVACKGEEKKDDAPAETPATMEEPAVEPAVEEEPAVEPALEEPAMEEPSEEPMTDEEEPMTDEEPMEESN